LIVTTIRKSWLVLLVIVALSIVARASPSNALTQDQVSNANEQIQSAFASTYRADQSGGNVTGLVADLNEAILLVAGAEAENSSNPTKAAEDIANATQIAQLVQSDSAQIGGSGAAARQETQIVALIAAAIVIAVASTVYVFGERIFRRVWLRLYRDYVVRPSNG
jgi:hypothetical protein